MTYKVKLGDNAKVDLNNISDYIEYNLEEPMAATNLVSKILKQSFSLSDNPYLFKLYDSEPWHSMGWRYFPVNNYLVFYIVDDATQSVEILRIIYGSRNIEQLL